MELHILKNLIVIKFYQDILFYQVQKDLNFKVKEAKKMSLFNREKIVVYLLKLKYEKGQLIIFW